MTITMLYLFLIKSVPLRMIGLVTQVTKEPMFKPPDKLFCPLVLSLRPLGLVMRVTLAPEFQTLLQKLSGRLRPQRGAIARSPCGLLWAIAWGRRPKGSV